VTTGAQLRGAYRALVLRTHPDAVGSERLLDRYLALSSQYEEARRLLGEAGGSRAAPPAGAAPEAAPGTVPRPTAATARNHRLLYFRALHQLERVDKPYSFHREENRARISELKARARAAFKAWNGAVELFDAADRDYDHLKAEKPVGPYLKDALAINVSPVFFNIVAFHLTGSPIYQQQVRQNLKAVLQKLADHHCTALRGFLEVLIDDMKDGPAVFDEPVERVARLPRTEGGP